MDEERLFSGWCRQTDRARRVLFTYEPAGGRRRIADADCGFFRCPFAAECPIAAEARAAAEGGGATPTKGSV